MSLENSLDTKNKIENKLKNFGDILIALDSTEDKKKLLWKDVYENAVSDREMASAIFTDLWFHVAGDPKAHLEHGNNLSKYLERMNKANEQILRLAELISKEEEQAMNANDVFGMIQSSKEI